MIKDKKELEQRTGPIEIDLTGPDGNAYVLLGMAHKFAKQIYQESMAERDDRLKDNEVRKLMDLPEMSGNHMAELITTEMKSGDYDNLIQVFDKYFGAFVTLYK
jgi:hypothetical protein